MLKSNNKKNIFVLLPVVILIWGVVFYKFFQRGENDIFETPSPPPYSKLLEDTASSTQYELDLSYRDPFLGKNKKVVIRKKNSIGNESRVPNNIERVMFPEVRYNGFVKNEKSAIAYLTVNGHSVLAETDEEFDEIRILNIQPDSVLIIYKNQKKWIIK